MSLVLRHKPEEIGLGLDANGWAEIGELIEKAGAHGMALTRELIAEVVATSDKQRFAIDADGHAHPGEPGAFGRYRSGPCPQRTAAGRCFTARARNQSPPSARRG